MNFNKVIFAIIVALMLLLPELSAQESEKSRTILRSDLNCSELWVPEIKVNSIQGDMGTLVGFYGGRLIDRKLLLGIAGGVNLTHPRVNYGYFGGICQYIIFPDNAIHFSTQVVLAYGTAKDYEDPREGLFDNFWNITGEDFVIAEPGFNLEFNLTGNLTLVIGLSYRFVNQANERIEFQYRS